MAVDAIETGDYDSAVKTLTDIVKSGRGVGDEPELLRIAKELQEKHSASARAPARQEPEPAPAPAPPPAVVAEREKPTPIPREPEPKRASKPSKPPPPKREERKVASAKPVPVISEREPEGGQVLVMSVPSMLTAEVDGSPAGTTPTRYSTTAGLHTVALYKGGQKVAERTVTVADNSVATVDFDVRDQLAPPPAVAAREAPREPPPSEPERTEKAAEKEPASAPPPTTPAAAAAAVAYGEVMVPPVSLAGEVFINGRSYGPPPVLARDVPVGTATVELRAGGAVKRSKVIPVDARQRATVKFR
jgi:hypothetical protein